MSQTITFTATQDDVDGRRERELVGTTLPSGVSLGATNETTSITDDDGAGVSVSESSLTIAQLHVHHVLESQTADVTVTINAIQHGRDRGTGQPDVLIDRLEFA